MNLIIQVFYEIDQNENSWKSSKHIQNANKNIHAPKSNPSISIDLTASSSFFMSVSSSQGFTSNITDDFPAVENGISTKSMPSQSGMYSQGRGSIKFKDNTMSK